MELILSAATSSGRRLAAASVCGVYCSILLRRQSGDGDNGGFRVWQNILGGSGQLSVNFGAARVNSLIHVRVLLAHNVAGNQIWAQIRSTYQQAPTMKGTILDFLKLATEKSELAQELVVLAAKHDFEFTND